MDVSKITLCSVFLKLAYARSKLISASIVFCLDLPKSYTFFDNVILFEWVLDFLYPLLLLVLETEPLPLNVKPKSPELALAKMVSLAATQPSLEEASSREVLKLAFRASFSVRADNAFTQPQPKKNNQKNAVRFNLIFNR